MKTLFSRAVLVLSAAACACAATPAWSLPVSWTGNGSSPRWSDPLNWSALRAPADGDEVFLGGGPPFARQAVDLSVALHSLVFAANAQSFEVRVAGDAANVLSFGVLGIQNLTGGSGPLRQVLFAAAGTYGGTVSFTNGSGINLGAPELFRPIDIVAQGGTATGAVGGHIVFQGTSSTGTTTFNALRAEGAAIAGASGGDIVFRGQAAATVFTTVSVAGGSATGAVGARASFADGTRLDGTLNVLAGESGGLGGRATFSGNAVAGFSASINNSGGTTFGGGSEGATHFRDDARLAGTAINGAGNGTAVGGGTLEFHERASFDSSGIDPTLGSVQIVNRSASVDLASAGRTVFRDDSFTRGINLVIVNAGNQESDVSVGGSTAFLDRSRAGQVTLINEGTKAPGAGGPTLRNGSTLFRDAASAENASIQQNGGNAAGALGGSVQFSGDATAAAAWIENQGGKVAGAFGGSASFGERAGAGNATVVNAAGQNAFAGGGATLFAGHSNAGSAFISNQTEVFSGGAQGGFTHFTDFASAQRATIDNQSAGQLSARASTLFSGNSTAADARLTNFGGRGGGGDALGAGATIFEHSSSAGTATIVNSGGSGNATGGKAEFTDLASAFNAAIVNQGGTSSDSGGSTTFSRSSTAGRSMIVNNGGSSDAAGGKVEFKDTASAFDATIVNQGGATSGSGGSTTFKGSSTAGRATIANLAGGSFGDGHTNFNDSASASAATVIAAGSTPSTVGSGRSSYIIFTDTSTADAATLIAQGATAAGSGNAGGLIVFSGLASGGTARVVLEASSVGGRGGALDISQLALDRSVGSIEGGGTVFLGSRTMYVGTRQVDTTFSGLISDGGLGGGTNGRLWVTGTGSLTLTGANTYSGGTIIGSSVGAPQGKLIVANTTGSATGSGTVSIEQSGTLSGSGFIAGPVILRAGGTIAPGDPVTLTLRDSLTWDGGGVIRLVLGSDSARSDHLNVGSLIRGSDGLFLFDLLDWGIVAGERYDLLSFDSIVGFAAGDFSVRGVDGVFSLDHGALGFIASGNVAAVPEPETYALLAGGLLLIGTVSRRRKGEARVARL